MNYEELKPLKCALCEKEGYLLIDINHASNNMFTGNQGICRECLKLPDLEQRFYKKSRAFIESQIENAQISLDHWKEVLAELEKEGEDIKNGKKKE